jgi:hypothetical protein
MITCPDCQGKALVLKTRPSRSSGITRRRLRCTNCSHRWTVWGDLQRKPVPANRPPRVKKPPLSDDALHDILTSLTISHSEMGRRYGRSHQTIAQIRLGQVQSHRLPEIPRWISGHTCEQCLHWRGFCGMGFPDPMDDGVAFARQCNNFMKTS